MEQTVRYPNLFTPIRLGNVTFKNRIFSAPTSLNWGAVDGNLTPETIAYYERKAKGGAAVVTMGESIVHSATGKSHDRQLELDNPTCLVSLTQLARAIKRHGAVPNIELSHGGKWGGLVSMAGANKAGKIAYGASAEHTDVGEVREMPTDLVLEVIESFGKGAEVAKRAGFEMCLVHAAHGWLFGQFLSPRTNHRTDRFGGSFENRASVLIMALESIRRHVGPGFPIEVRISGDEFIEGGLTLEDGIHLAKLIEDKCDLINVSGGIHEDLALYLRTHPTNFAPKGPNVYLAEAIRKEVKNVAISTVGAITEPAMMEEIIASGKADIVELGRPLLADPDLPEKLLQGREREVTRCLRCMSCFGDSVTTENLHCAVNPIIGNEFNNNILISMPTKPKRAVVAGGGPGGMKAAITLARRGHEVTLLEQSNRLGGALQFAQYVDFKRDLYDFSQHLAYLMSKEAVEVRLNTPATAEAVQALRPDALYVAVGASPIVPSLPGVKGGNVMCAQEVYGKESTLGKDVVILGGGLVGVETAIHLAREGKNVTVVELREDVALDAELFYRKAVLLELERSQVKCVTETAGQEITEEGLRVIRKDGGTELLQADTVVVAVGYRSNLDTVAPLRRCAPKVELVGDCRRPGKVTDAIFDGYYLAMDL